MPNIGNNIQFQFDSGITSGSSTCTVKGGKEALLPAVPFRLTLTQFDSGGAIKQMEIVDVTNIAGNVLTITRAVEACPKNANEITSVSVAYDFNHNDYAFLNFTASMFDDLVADIATALAASGSVNRTLVNLTSNQLIAYNVVTKVGLDSVVYDNGSDWNSGSNRYDVPLDGYYRITGLAAFNNMVAYRKFSTELRINNVRKQELYNSLSTGTDNGRPVGTLCTTVQYCTAGQYIELFCKQEEPSTSVYVQSSAFFGTDTTFLLIEQL